MRHHWLLTIEIAGRTHRYAVDDVEVTDADGVTWLYRGGLGDLSISESLGDGRPSVAVQIHDGMTDWAAEVAAGAWLEGGAATLVLWTEGTELEEAMWAAGGIVVSPEYGSAFEALTVSIEPRQRGLLFPPADAAISAKTWPVTSGLVANSKRLGVVYPWVFGEPGKRGGVAEFQSGVIAELLDFQGVYSTPGYVAEVGLVSAKGATVGPVGLDSLIIAGFAVEAAKVTVSPVGQGYPWRMPVIITSDALGREVSTVRSEELWRFEPDGEYWISWDSGAGLGITGAGSVLRYMLEQAGETIDSGRWATASAALDVYRLDFAVTERVDPHQWAAAHLGELLPIALRWGPRGCWYELVPWATASPGDVTVYLDGSRERGDGEPVTREGGIAWTGADSVVTRATLTYRRYMGDRYAATIEAAVTYGGDRTERGPIGVREAAYTCDIVDDDATAGAMLESHLAWRSTPRRVVTVSGGLELLRAEVGAVVAYSESEVSMTREVAIVTDREVRRDSVRLRLTLVERAPLRGAS